jgi:1,2-phenylacetyl-CoA epoxidase catalytic subunit
MEEPRWKAILREHGPEFIELILTVYVNSYDSELEIIDICGKWIPRRKILKEKLSHVLQAHDEIRHMNMFKAGLAGLGFEWDELDHEKYRVRDIAGRFDALAASDDDLQVQIGMNMYAEGVLAMEELVQLGEHAPEYFPGFLEIAKDQIRHTGYGKAIARRLMSESEENRARAQTHCDFYRDHLLKYVWGDISDLVDLAVAHRCASADFREKVAIRFEDVMTSVGLKVTWPDEDLQQRLRAMRVKG